jgi:hypothetical protein
MVRNCEQKIDVRNWSEDTTLLSAVKASEVDLMPPATGAKTCAVPRNISRRRVLPNIDTPKYCQYTTEEELVTCAVKLHNTGYGLTYRNVGSLVYRFASINGMKPSFNDDLQMVGKDWVRCFLSSHKNLKSQSRRSSIIRSSSKDIKRERHFYDHRTLITFGINQPRSPTVTTPA